MKTLTVVNKGSLTRLDVPLGSVPAGKTRVQVKYAGVGRTDITAMRGGYLLAPNRPFTPGYEYAGVDEQGRRVAGILARMGTYQEVIDVDPRWVVEVPQFIDDTVAAALPLNYLTALALLEKTTNLAAGSKVLVLGAGGAVGQALLELARVRGLKTYGVASRGREADLNALGAVLLDRQGDWETEARAQVPKGFDAVFDAQGLASFRRSWKLLAKGGTLAVYGFVPDLNGGLHHYVQGLAYIFSKALYPSGKKAAVCGLPHIVASDLTWYRDAMRRLFELVLSGAVRPVVQGVFAWNDVEKAHAVIVEGRIRGKLLLDFTV